MTVRHLVSEGRPPAKPERRGRPRDKQQYASRFPALGLDDRGCLTITASTLTGERTVTCCPSDNNARRFY